MELLLQETRSFSLIHVQQVVDVLCSLFHYSLAIAQQTGCQLPLNVPLEDLIDVAALQENTPDMLRAVAPQLNAATKHCILKLARCVPGSREYFDVLENALYMVEESVGARARGKV